MLDAACERVTLALISGCQLTCTHLAPLGTLKILNSPPCYQVRNAAAVREEQRLLFSLYAASRFCSCDFRSVARGRADVAPFDVVPTLTTHKCVGCRDIRLAAIAKQQTLLLPFRVTP